MLDLLAYVVAFVYFVWMSVLVSNACLLYRAQHLGEKAGFAGFVVWVLLAVFPTALWLFLWS